MADTIDFWHIYYNNVKIQECNIYSKYELHLKLDSIKAEDSITVRYFRDTPCEDCEIWLDVSNYQYKRKILVEGKGIFCPLTFKLKELIEYYKKGNVMLFGVHYWDKFNVFQQELIPIFNIKLE